MSVTKEDFEAKIIEVASNLYLSHFHLKIHEKMTEQLNDRLEEYPPFFKWSRMAHYETGILGLTRAYDKNSLGLLKIINIFQSEYRRWNLSDTLDIKQLEEDRNFVTPAKNNLVDGLMQLRDKVVSHTDNNLYPRKVNFNIQNIYGGELIYIENRITTEEIEKLPKEEKQKYLNQVSANLFEAIQKDNTEILGKQVPSFEQLYELTNKGVEICNRYMENIGVSPIELKLEGID